LLFNYTVRHIVLTSMLTWRGWSEKPAWFWKPFTASSLGIAAAGALFWPYLGGDRVYEAVFGASFFTPTPPHLEGHGAGLAYTTLCYIVWSLALLPHTLVRIGALVYSRVVSHRGEP
jgi:hypothetical protein